MKLGTHVVFPDGRVGTVVFHSLIGVGIKWGLHEPPMEDFEGTSGGLMPCERPAGWPWRPDALLRAPWPGCEQYGFSPEHCVGGDFEVVREEGYRDVH